MKMKKFCILAVLVIFLLSLVPAALAEQPTLAQNLKQAKVKLVKARERLESAAEFATEKYEQISERYQDARDKYLESKEKVDKLRSKVLACEDDDNCEPEKQRFRNQTRDQMVHLSGVILETLNKLKEKIESSDLSDEDKADLLTDIEARIEEIVERKDSLTDWMGDITSEDLQDSTVGIKNSWGKTKPKIKLGTGRLINAKLGNIIVSVEKLQSKFDRIRERLSGQGYDVTGLDDYLDDLNETMSAAMEKWELAKGEFQKAKDSENVAELQAAISAAHQYQKESRDKIKEARQEIRRIVKEIRELQGSLDDGSGEDNEIESEDNSEDESEEEEEETGDEVNDFESCVAAGNPIMESYPRQCSHDNQTFVEELDEDNNETESGDEGEFEDNETEG